MAGERVEKALQVWRKRYRQSTRSERSAVLDEVCRVGGYHRKYAIALLNRPDEEDRPRRRRGATYSAAALGVVETIWKKAGYPWSERLKALLPLWLPYARESVGRLTPEIERQALSISARQMDRRLAARKRKLKRRLYGRTKPGALLKHRIAIQTRPWDVTEPGSAEIDLVSHSGPSARGEFAHSLNLTDVFSGWCETRAILGRGEEIAARCCNFADANAPSISWRDETADDGYAATAPVGGFPPNAFGLYDMIGNVWEQCADWYGEVYYAGSPSDDPPGSPSDRLMNRVLRGGSWMNGPSFCRSAFRMKANQANRSANNGFRVVVELQEKQRLAASSHCRAGRDLAGPIHAALPQAG